MKSLFELFPIILFFIAYYAYDIFVATGVVIGATLFQVGWMWLKHRKVDKMMWISLMAILLFGGATLAFQDETFIKWKPTVLYWIFAGVLWGASLFLGKNLIRIMLEKQVQLPDAVWKNLNLSWIAFFVFMGVINVYIAFNFSLDTWVNFKLFGSTGLMLVFVIAQISMFSKHLQVEVPVGNERQADGASMLSREETEKNHKTDKD